MDTVDTIVLVFGILCLIGGTFSRGNISKNDNEIIYEANFTRGGAFFFPDRLILTPTSVTHYQNGGIMRLYMSYAKQTIPFKRITGLQVIHKLIGVNIIIIGEGFQNIQMTNLAGADANQIEQMINIVLEDNVVTKNK